jgi:hypothetical protein
MAPPDIFGDFLFHANFVLVRVYNSEIHGPANCVMQLQFFMQDHYAALKI